VIVDHCALYSLAGSVPATKASWMVRPPLAVFEEALVAFAERYGF